jgi:hypothetical protein
MKNPNLNLLEAAVRVLEPLVDDLVAVIDGRPEIVEDVGTAPPDVRLYLASEIRELLSTERFVDALPGFLLPDSATQGRLPLLPARLAALSGFGAAQLLPARSDLG